MNPVQKYLPWGVLTLAGIYLAYCALPARQTTKFNLDDVGSLPAYHGGRLQPLDSLARNSLMIISGRQTFVEELPDGGTVRQPAIKWLMDVWLSDARLNLGESIGPAGPHKVFRIENEQVLNLLGLEPRSGLRYSLDEMRPKIDVIERRYVEAKNKETKARDLVDEKVMELRSHLNLFQELASHTTVLLIPPDRPKQPWAALAELQGHGLSGVYLKLMQYYSNNQADNFDKLTELFRAELDKKFSTEMGKAQFESFFNRFAPFYRCMELYIFVIILTCMSWLVWPKELGQAAFALGIMTLVLHFWALIARMYMMDRWFVFVTNLYSSGIFIGFGCAFVGLILEYFHRNGVGSVVGAVAGSLSLIIAHFLSLSGDTLGMVVAVLDTNFWLATHVTCITFGYSATFMAGCLGIAYVVANLAIPNLSREFTQAITRMIYGVVCFAMFLSFTGTVLGGIWADQSWGRFWGWDPKENGALLIVLMNALLLHARWGGMVKARGMAVLAILGNIVTAWSWFGVNMLGVGLHSYGFMEGAAFWLITFVVSQLLLAGLGMLDPVVVRSFITKTLVPTPQPAKETVQS